MIKTIDLSLAFINSSSLPLTIRLTGLSSSNRLDDANIAPASADAAKHSTRKIIGKKFRLGFF